MTAHGQNSTHHVGAEARRALRSPWGVDTAQDRLAQREPCQGGGAGRGGTALTLEKSVSSLSSQ